MWKDKLKGLFKEVCDGVKDVYEDMKEEVKDANIGEHLKKAGEELKKAGQELKEEFLSEGNTEAKEEKVQNVSGDQNTLEASVTYEVGDEEVALSVPTEDGERGEFSGLDDKTYSYLIPKDEGFIDEGNCHAAEIHQAYGFGREINYERDVMFVFSIAGEFDCEIKESRAKAAYTRYDSAPIRSKLMEIEHPVFTHAYLFETTKKYRITYLKQLGEYELLGCELILRKSGGDDVWKAKMIEEFKRFAGSCREV